MITSKLVDFQWQSLLEKYNVLTAGLLSKFPNVKLWCFGWNVCLEDKYSGDGVVLLCLYYISQYQTCQSL